MLNCNGVIVSSLKLVEEDLIHSLLTAFSIQESIRLKKNNIFFFGGALFSSNCNFKKISLWHTNELHH
jgi:hypothetical protein